MSNKKAPDFCLFNQKNEMTCLKDFRNKWIILYFYPKDNSKGCTLEAIEFTNNLQTLYELDAIILGVSPDSIKSHQNFAQKHNLKIILLSDPEHKIIEKYGAWQLKKMYGREYMGVIRSTFIINPEGKIEKEWKKVRVKNHVEKVKQELMKLIK
ncbi:MAG: peroxiredoxin [Candidatus Bathyarchaeota archaeon]